MTVRNGAEVVCVRNLYAFGERIHRFAKVNVNKSNMFVLYRIHSSCKLFISMYTFIIDNVFICIA